MDPDRIDIIVRDQDSETEYPINGPAGTPPTVWWDQMAGSEAFEVIHEVINWMHFALCGFGMHFESHGLTGRHEGIKRDLSRPSQRHLELAKEGLEDVLARVDFLLNEVLLREAEPSEESSGHSSARRLYRLVSTHEDVVDHDVT